MAECGEVTVRPEFSAQQVSATCGVGGEATAGGTKTVSVTVTNDNGQAAQFTVTVTIGGTTTTQSGTVGAGGSTDLTIDAAVPDRPGEALAVEAQVTSASPQTTAAAPAETRGSDEMVPIPVNAPRGGCGCGERPRGVKRRRVTRAFDRF